VKKGMVSDWALAINVSEICKKEEREPIGW
jgi:hypothetical protein